MSLLSLDALNQIIDDGLAIVKQRYGAEAGDGEHPLYYHNYTHTQDVLAAAEKVADLAVKRGKIAPTDVDLIRIAAAYHDAEQLLGSGPNEAASARLAGQRMAGAGFGPQDVTKVTNMIMSTQVHFAGGIMRQSASENYCTQILADADLASLGGPTAHYEDRALRLLRELKGHSQLTDQEKREFFASQEAFLRHHKYHTAEAEELFPHKEANILHGRQIARSMP